VNGMKLRTALFALALAGLFVPAQLTAQEAGSLPETKAPAPVQAVAPAAAQTAPAAAPATAARTAHEEQVKNAMRIILSDANVKAILINIFGGIMRCDIIATGVVNAVKEIGIKVPVVVRLEGTNVEEGKAILKSSGLAVIPADGMKDAAEKVIASLGKAA